MVLPGPLDAFRDVQQNCAEQQRQANAADDDRSNCRVWVTVVVGWGSNPGKLSEDSNCYQQGGKPTP